MSARPAKRIAVSARKGNQSPRREVRTTENPIDNMAVVRKKQDDKNLKTLRELVTSGGSGGNRQCFDCGQKGPTYVNMTIGSFVCTRCSGVLRGLTPPHRVKSISMATFTPEEIEFLRTHGNDMCAKTWLGLWDPKRIIHQDQRELMIDKYERKRYYLEPASPLKSLTTSAATKAPPMMNGSIVNGTSNGIHLNGTSNSTNSNNNNNNHSSSNNNNNSYNNNSISNGGLKATTIENNLKNLALTPPSTLRLSSNSINSSSSSTNSSRQQNGYNSFQIQFTPDDNNFFDSSSSTVSLSSTTANNKLMNGGNGNTNTNASHHLTNGGSGLNIITNHLNNCQISNKNSLNVQPSTNNSNFLSNKFTPDSDFVADFGSANIFNATSATSAANHVNGLNKSSSVSTSSVNPLNGFKIHQNGTNGGTNHINANNFVNGEMKATASTNGNCNGNSISNANANFADFDHASIYNAAGLPMSFNSTSNSLSSSATFTSNSSINSTPPADRYAALKDLDDQIRESKTSLNGSSFNSPAPAAASPNPFTQSTPIAIVAPANTNHQQSHHQIGNPFQTQQSFSQPTAVTSTNMFSTSNHQQQSTLFDDTSPPFGTTPPSLLTATYSTTNGYVGGMGGCGNGVGSLGLNGTILSNGGTLNNGCGGLAYVPQQVTTGGNAVITNMKNPFATVNAISNSNNPFL